MAEFCNKCIDKVFPGEEPDIDVDTIAAKLKRGHQEYVVCEGCGVIHIAKDRQGNIFIEYLKN
jgi:hypothetical protein